MNEIVSSPGSYIEIAETNTALHLTNLVCYYDDVNANGVMLPYGETEEEQQSALEKAQTLRMMPVYAKCKRDRKGKDNFGSHELSVDPVTHEYTFGTTPIGVHENVYIEEHEVETVNGEVKKLPCLMAKQVIWKRNKNAVSAIRRLFSENKLRNSWEIMTHAYEYRDGVKILTDYEFMGNTFLGNTVAPAYGAASKVLDVACTDENAKAEVMLADALYQDYMDQNNEVRTMNENEQKMDENEVCEPSTAQDGEFVSENIAAENAPNECETAEEAHEESQDATEMETSALTSNDICDKLRKAFCCDMRRDGYCAFLFPEEHVAWFHEWGHDETEFTQIAYTVQDNEVTITGEETVRIALPIRELSQKYTEVSEKAKNLTDEVEELSKCKKRLAEIEDKEKEAKHNKEVAELRQYAIDAGCFTDEEIAGMQELFDNVSTLEVKAAVSDRLLAKRSQKTVEVSTDNAPRTNLEQEMEAPIDYVASVRNFLNN